MQIFDFIALSGAEQAKIVVMALFSIALFVVIPYFRRNKPDKDNLPKSGENNNSKRHNINSNVMIRTDGYYLGKITKPNLDNVMTTLHFLLIFTKKGFVCYQEIEDIIEWRKYNSNDSIRDGIIEINKIQEIEINPYLTNFKVKNEEITMKFFDIEDFANDDVQEPRVYNEWYGSILEEGLLLSFDYSYFSYALSEYEKSNLFKNVKFDFIKCKF